jgi:hypothetical protein
MCMCVCVCVCICIYNMLLNRCKHNFNIKDEGNLFTEIKCLFKINASWGMKIYSCQI